MNYAEISKKTVSHLYQAYAQLTDIDFDRKIMVLCELRVSQLNGCAYCCALHHHEAVKIGCSTEALVRLPGWRISSEFDDCQKAALAYAESLHFLSSDLPVRRAALALYLSEKGVVDLTLSIGIMETFNRMAIALGTSH